MKTQCMEGEGVRGASANENEANEINFQNPPTTQKQKGKKKIKNRRDRRTNMLPALTRTRAPIAARQARERARE